MKSQYNFLFLVDLEYPRGIPFFYLCGFRKSTLPLPKTFLYFLDSFMKQHGRQIVLFFFCLVFSLCAAGADGADGAGRPKNKNVYAYGGIVRTDPSKKRLVLAFTAAGQADGAAVILRVLRRERVVGAFFFTGRFFELYPDVVSRIKADGHYIGPHGYAHLLYCAWEQRDSTLVSKDTFVQDLRQNYRQLADAGISAGEAPFFMPAYEYYNDEISAWAEEMGIQVVNFTPGSGSNADYTTPNMKNYRSSRSIYERILETEKVDGLNGHILLLHLGTDMCRTDKFYTGYLQQMIRELKRRGYVFVPLEKAVGK